MKPQRFFPAPSATPRAASMGPTFLAKPDNLLHRRNSGGRLHGQDSAVLSAIDNVQNTGIRPSTQLAYSALIRKPNAQGLAFGSAGSILRPGTAAPRVGEHPAPNIGVEMGNISVIAPTPKKLHQTSPPFAFQNGSFGSGSVDASGNNDPSNSPDNLVEEKGDESFKMPFPKKTSIQQRVPAQSELSQYQPRSLQRNDETSPISNDCRDQDGPSTSLSFQRSKKHMREHDGIENAITGREAKRFKSHGSEEFSMSQHESISSHLERPSSTASSAVGSYYDRSDAVVVNTPPAQCSRIERQDSIPTTSSNRIHAGLPGRRPSEPIGLDKLLGLGSNDLLDQYANNYEDLLKKWSECSVDEWKAGAEEISAQFTSMLDFVKDYLDKKLKTYSGLNDLLDSHCEILRERSESMELTRQQLVKEGRKVLG